MAGKSPREMVEAVIRNMPKRTGKSVNEWARIVAAKGPSEKTDRVEWLKKTHKLGHVTAQIVAGAADGTLETYGDEPELVRKLFGPPGAKVRRIYEAVLRTSERLPGVRVSTGKAYVSLRRKRQFARIKPAGDGTLHVYMALDPKQAPASERLERVRGGDTSLTFRVALSSPAQMDEKVRSWLRTAARRA